MLLKKYTKLLFLFSFIAIFFFLYSCMPLIQENPVSLNFDEWTDVKITYGCIKWFYIDCKANNIYLISLISRNDGFDEYDVNVDVSAYHEDKKTSFFEKIGLIYEEPEIIKTEVDERVYIKVSPLTDYPTGTFSIKVTSIEPKLLVNGTWDENSINSNEEKWFYFDAVAGNTYDISWDDSYSGSGSYSADISVSAYHEDLTRAFFVEDDSGYSYPRQITVDSNERVYIKVETFSSGGMGGTFAIKYTQN